MSDILFAAVEFATDAHRGQLRKGTIIPYIVHPVAVCRLLLANGCPEILGVAGVLHDVVEDTAATREDIQERFGSEVLRLVDGASEPDKSASWEDRKQHTLHFLETADQDILLITLCDKLDNAESILDDLELHGDATWARFSRGRDIQQTYFEGLAEVFHQRLTSGPGVRLARRFQGVVAQLFPKTLKQDS